MWFFCLIGYEQTELGIHRSIDMEHLAGDVAAHVGTEKHTGIGNFLRLPATLHRDGISPALNCFLIKYLGHLCFYESRRHRIATDVAGT